MRGNLVADFLEARRAIADTVHFVDDDGDLFDAEQMQEIAVTPRLVAHAFERIDDQHRAIGLRGAGNHIAQEFGVAGRIDQHHVARTGAETDLRGVDGDALVAFGLQCVEQERPFERHAAPRAHGFEHLELAFGEAAGLEQQTSDQGRFAVIDVADDDDADLGRVVPLGIADTAGGTNTFIVYSGRAGSEIAGGAEPLEGIFGFMI